MHSLLTLILSIAFEPRLASLVVLGGDVLALLALPSVLLRRSGRPLAALSWVLALLTLPYAGVLAWWLLGRTHLVRQRTKRKRASKRLGEQRPPLATAPVGVPARLRDVLPFSLAGRRWTEGVFPPAAFTRAQVLCDGQEAFPAMEAAIAGAKVEVRAAFYIWQSDSTGRRIADLVAQKARSGVRVRILVDAVGSHAFLRDFGKRLRHSGVEVASFLPARFRPWAPTFNFRNHRKLLLVDRHAAFVGGMNIGDEYAAGWHDLAFELRGPVVEHLDDVFREDWLFATKADVGPSAALDQARPPPERIGLCGVIASGPDRDEHRVPDAFFLGINQAKQRVWMASPYFVPSAAFLAALRGAAQRGLDVRVVLPRLNDVPFVRWASRSYYDELLRAGIRIFEFQPRFSHMKAMVLDDDLSVIGSANADVRSFRLNFELVCIVDSAGLNARISEILARDVSLSREVTLEEINNAPRIQVLLDSFANLWSPLL